MVVVARPLRLRAARVGLWGLVAVGALGGAVGALRGSPPPVVEVTDDGATVAVPVEVAGFAEVAVRAWLAAGAETAPTLDEVFLVAPPLRGVDAAAREVGATAVVSARLVEEGYWAITVAAEVADGAAASAAAEELAEGGLDGETGVGRAVWYLEVGVIRDGSGRLVAAAAPAVVPAPAPGGGARVAGPALSVAEGDDAVTATAEAFLTALLAGGGDVARYAAPGAEITAVQPPLFASVELERAAVVELASGEQRARLEVRATTTAGTEQVLGYEVLLVSRADRWEVRSVTGAPALTTDSPPPSSADGTTSTTSTTPTSSTTTLAPTPGA